MSPVPSPKKEVRTEAADGQARRKRVLFSEETGKGSQMRWQGEWKGMSVRRNSTSKASNTAGKAERARNTVNLQERQGRPEPEYAGLLTPMLTQAQWHNGRMLSEGATGSNGSHLAETLRPNVVLNIHSASLKTHSHSSSRLASQHLSSGEKTYPAKVQVTHFGPHDQ